MSGPDFHYPRRRAVRRHRSVRSRRQVGSNFWLTPLMAVGFVAALAGFQHGPTSQADDAPVATTMPFLRANPVRSDALSARFGLCHGGGGSNCVVDGDTFWFSGEKYRIADIDTPETHPARCAEEAALGEAATDRLRDWLNDGAFTLKSTGRDTDRYGRKLRVPMRDGESVGSVLVDEGLARRWEGRRRPWC